MTAAKRLALSTGLIVALFVFGIVPAAHSGVVPAAQSGSGLKVQDRSHDNDNPDNTLYALYQLVNTGTSSVPLSSLTMRYWFTNETPADPLVFECDWAQVGCANVTSKFVALASPVTKANTSSIRDKIGLPSPAVVTVLAPRNVALVACAPSAAPPARIVATITAPRGI